jgi:hypothetical protein
LEDYGGEEEEGKDWLGKYKAEWIASNNKMFFELPKNSLIQVRFEKDEVIWSKYPIYENWFMRSSLDNNCETDPETSSQQLIQILLESVTELVSNIGHFEPYFHHANKY